MSDVPANPFSFTFTTAKLTLCLAPNKEAHLWFDPLTMILPDYGITTVDRVAAFLAQTGHESASFKTLSENLNYGWEGLRKIFGKYFPTDALAKEYERKPEKIANKVYASRMGNGNEASGDGWKFRGKGLIQITGKDNTRACSKAIFGDERLVQDPAWLLTKEGALKSACWFWNERKLNELADKHDILTMTKKINGGTIGLEDRKAKFEKFLGILKG